MRNNEALVLSAANLDIIERNLGSLAENIGAVSLNMEHVDNKVNKVTESVKTIEDEIKKFMVEIRENTVVSNARQTIMMDQDELNKKYGHYDALRRKVNGLFQATDINAIKKSTIENLSQEVMINTPDYWLAPALVAICAWFNNNQELANSALKEALRRDDEKTSLLFCLIHLRAKRYKGTNAWLRRYLDMQDPTKMEIKIVALLDAITNGVFDQESQKYCLLKIEQWIKELDAQTGYKDIQVDAWKEHFKTKINNNSYDSYNYLNSYVSNHEAIFHVLDVLESENNILDELEEIIRADNNGLTSYNNVIDKTINSLIFNYEIDELDLRKDIAKNRFIIEENGDVEQANKKLDEQGHLFNKTVDFDSILTGMIIDNKTIKPTNATRKMALALSKNWLLEAFNSITDNNNSTPSFNITIDNWTATTIDGSNENELIADLVKTNEENLEMELSKKHILDFKSIFTVGAGIITTAIAFLLKLPIIGILILIISLIMFGYFIFSNYQTRRVLIKQCETNNSQNTILLKNILAEVVDFHFMINDEEDDKNKIVSFINSLDYNSYIGNVDNERQIESGGYNG
jgi:hypothetical protein